MNCQNILRRDCALEVIESTKSLQQIIADKVRMMENEVGLKR